MNCIILVRTATAAIDITTIRISSATLCDRLTIFGIGNFLTRGNTDSTTINSHLCIVEGMTILTTAIDRTPDFRATGRSSRHITLLTFSSLNRRSSCAYGHNRVIDPSRMVIALFWLIDVTS